MLEEYQKRVIAEQDELLVKTNKLIDFIDGDSETYKETSLMEKERLATQLFIMQRYDSILTHRIAAFEEIG